MKLDYMDRVREFELLCDRKAEDVAEEIDAQGFYEELKKKLPKEHYDIIVRELDDRIAKAAFNRAEREWL